MSDVQIRAAVESDWPTLADYNIRLAAETEDKSLDPPTVEAGVRGLFSDPTRGRYFVACINGRVVGQLMHTFEWSDWRNGEIWWLQSVYVHPEFRRRGIFRSLNAHLTQLADETPGVVGLRLYVEHENDRAQQTYHALGMKDPGYRVMEAIFVDR